MKLGSLLEDSPKYAAGSEKTESEDDSEMLSILDSLTILDRRPRGLR